MSRSKDRADRIREEIPISEVLATYGYTVVPGLDREQQFSCDLHGDGTDSKPSARAYPDTNQWYCFACATSRDAIQTVREKEGLDFRGACDVLERRYNLPALAWTEDEEKVGGGFLLDLEDILRTPAVTAADVQSRVRTLLMSVTAEKSMPLGSLLGLWEEHDRLALSLSSESETIFDEFNTLKDRVVNSIRLSS